MDPKQKGSDALQDLIRALRRKGADSHIASWALINAAKRESKDGALTPADLQHKLCQQLGMNVDISTAEAMVAMGDQGCDGKLGFHSWGKLLGNELQNIEVFKAPLSARPKSALSKAPVPSKPPKIGESPRSSRPVSADRARVQKVEQQKIVGRQNSFGNGQHDGDVEKFLEAELNAVIGLDNVKTQLRQFVQNLKLDQRRRELCLLPEGHYETYDMVFYGNPGTGKTSIARLIPKLLERIGVINPGAPFAEVGRQDLVGAYIGSTEEKTQKRIEDSRGGVLFIDEAYTLTEGSGGRDFGIKALETIMQCMTSEDRKRPVFIFAGYQAQMESFLLANPGMARRVAYKFHFEDYTPAQLAEIAARKSAARGFALTDAARRVLPRVFDTDFTPAARALWNGGLAARLISESVQCLNARLEPTAASKAELCTLEERDIVAGSRAAATAVMALQAVSTPGSHSGSGDDGAGSPRRRPPVPSGGAAAGGKLPVSTLHLKEYWPSAMLRIAALEEELVRARRAEDHAAGAPPPPGAAAVESGRSSPPGPSANGNKKGDHAGPWAEVTRAAKQAAAAVEQAAAAEAGAAQDAAAGDAERLLAAALEALRAARTAVGTTPPAHDQNPRAGAQSAAALAAGQVDSHAPAAANPAPIAAGAAAGAPAGGDGLAVWLVGVRTNGLPVGECVPAAWAEGLHYAFGAATADFAVGDTVVAVRSDRRRTFASVAAVKDGAGTVELLVGTNLQKATAADRVGRLHAGLLGFFAHRRAAAGGGAAAGWCVPPAPGAVGAWMDGVDPAVVTSLLHLDADERRRAAAEAARLDN